MVTDSPQLSYTPAREEVTGEASPSVTHPRQTPHDRLALALAGLLAEGNRPPCCDGSGAWTSDDRDEREVAARACLPCVIRSECAAAADDTREVWGVWGGTDRAPRPPRRGPGGTPPGSSSSAIPGIGGISPRATRAWRCSDAVPADLPTADFPAAHTKGLNQ